MKIRNLTSTLLFLGVALCAQSQRSATPTRTTESPSAIHHRPTSADRKAAARRSTARRAAVAHVAPSAPVPGGMPDYFGVYPNYANSPRPAIDSGSGTISGGIRKFVDALPGLGPANANNLGQFIPIATPLVNPDGTPVYPGSDYYEIGAVS